ncbi:MAG TPA: hypothetical protein VHI52_09025 [Verrucomicrobiae bacterium]|nr:hypothetical protein [Verrucomicrobiae bacterium]
MRRWVPLVALVAVGVAFYSIWRSTGQPSSVRNPANAVSQSTIAHSPAARTTNAGPVSRPALRPDVDGSPGLPVPVTNSTAALPAKVESLPQDLAGVAPETALQNMRSTIRQYGSMFSGNPVGTNQEITQELKGENPRHINFLTEDGNRVNSNGELVDTWGTPYFFHQISGHEMEIRSAGPDHIMYTGDDLVVR